LEVNKYFVTEPQFCWTPISKCPDLEAGWEPDTEAKFAEFLNHLADTISTALSIPTLCRWTAKYSTTCIFGTKRKPDLVLFDRSTSTEVDPALANWRVVRAVAEIKSSSKNTAMKETLDQLSDWYQL
jgi:hypothetical protein